MGDFTRVPLEGGGFILFEAPEGVRHDESPVGASRIGDAVRDLPGTLQSALAPVRETAQAVLDQLRAARPHEVEVQFGVDLSTSAGVVITNTAVKSNLAVRLVWRRSDAEPDPATQDGDEQSGTGPELPPASGGVHRTG
ncbi:CU044_2847 family protein [Streptomyces sp. NPDC001920]